MGLEEAALARAEVEARAVLVRVVAGALWRRGHRPRQAVVRRWS